MNYLHQDWSPCIIKSKSKKVIQQKKNNEKIITEKKFNAGKNNQNLIINSKKIEEKINNDNYETPKISFDIKIQIQQARQKKNMTQKELAKACNLPENLIRDYEQGKGIPNSQHLSKISRILSITFTN